MRLISARVTAGCPGKQAAKCIQKARIIAGCRPQVPRDTLQTMKSPAAAGETTIRLSYRNFRFVLGIIIAIFDAVNIES